MSTARNGVRAAKSVEESSAPVQLEFDDNRLLSQLCGAHDAHLARLERRLGVVIVAKGNRLTLTGPSGGTDAARSALTLLYDRLKRGREVDGAEVDAAARMSEGRGGQIGGDGGPAIDLEQLNGGELVLRTRRRQITPRSPVQAAYIRAMQNHELTFGLGPAGTGKTYLAVAVGVTGNIVVTSDGLRSSSSAEAGGPYTALNRGDGTWRTLDVIHPALTPGQYDVLVRATDPAGNVSQHSFVSVLTILTPQAPIIEVDDPSTLFAADIEHNYQTGQLSVSVLAENRSGRTVHGPVPLIVEEIDSSHAGLANPDGLTEDGKPYVDIAKALNGGQLDPGELVRVDLVFDQALDSSFGSKLSTRGALTAGPEPAITTTPPVMTIQSLPTVRLSDRPTVPLSNRLTISAPEVDPEPLDDLVEINLLQQQFKHQTGQARLGLLLTNRSGQTIRGAPQLTVEQVSSPIVARPDRLESSSSGNPVSSSMDGLGFGPGQSLSINPTFNTATRHFFQFKPGIHSFPDTDDRDDWWWYPI